MTTTNRTANNLRTAIIIFAIIEAIGMAFLIYYIATQ